MEEKRERELRQEIERKKAGTEQPFPRQAQYREQRDKEYRRKLVGTYVRKPRKDDRGGDRGVSQERTMKRQTL